MFREGYMSFLRWTHKHAFRVAETGTKKVCGRRGGVGGGKPQGMPLWLPPAIALLNDRSNSDCMCAIHYQNSLGDVSLAVSGQCWATIRTSSHLFFHQTHHFYATI